MSESIKPDKFRQAEFVRVVHNAEPGPHVSYGDLYAKTYWSQVARLMHVGDHIEVDPADKRFFAVLRVVDCGMDWAKVVEISYVDLIVAKANAEARETTATEQTEAA